MSVAMIGLIVMQHIWVNSAIKVKEKKFDFLVEKSLSEIVEKIGRMKYSDNELFTKELETLTKDIKNYFG